MEEHAAIGYSTCYAQHLFTRIWGMSVFYNINQE